MANKKKPQKKQQKRSRILIFLLCLVCAVAAVRIVSLWGDAKAERAQTAATLEKAQALQLNNERTRDELRLIAEASNPDLTEAERIELLRPIYERLAHEQGLLYPGERAFVQVPPGTD